MKSEDKLKFIVALCFLSLDSPTRRSSSSPFFLPLLYSNNWIRSSVKWEAVIFFKSNERWIIKTERSVAAAVASPAELWEAEEEKELVGVEQDMENSTMTSKVHRGGDGGAKRRGERSYNLSQRWRINSRAYISISRDIKGCKLHFWSSGAGRNCTRQPGR